MLDSLSKQFFKVLAGSAALKRVASAYGMRPGGFARRFIAGESVDEAMPAVRDIEAAGLATTLDLLGESVSSAAEAAQATEAYVAVIKAIAAAGVTRNISVKLTQLGLDVGEATCIENFTRILDESGSRDFFVRIDMENSPYTDVTLEIFETLWQQGHRRIGVVLQSALHRTEQDLGRMNALGARVRLVKGAYKEPASVAYSKKSDVDDAYAREVRMLLVDGHYPAIATHDPKLIELTRKYADEHGTPRDHFEFQMLYGVRRDLQQTLVRDGYRVRVYIPFGREWFPYFMRRLGERPANVMFVVRGILGETTG